MTRLQRHWLTGAVAAALVLGGCQSRSNAATTPSGPAGADSREPAAPEVTSTTSTEASAPSVPTPTATPAAPGTPAAVPAANVLFVGHSLVNWTMPGMVAALATSARRDHRWSAQIGNGGTIQLQWMRSAEGVNARETLEGGEIDVLVLTEAIPLESHVRWSGSVEFAGNFYALAQRAHPGARVYMYETWHSTEEPDWRARIGRDRALWERIVDQVNAAQEGPDMRLIPGGTALGVLVDRVEAGGVPGLTDRQALFDDHIHLNDLGNYFIACVQFATIYRMSPVGLTRDSVDRWGTPYGAPSPEVARVMQEVAWQVVSTDPRAGLR